MNTEQLSSMIVDLQTVCHKYGVRIQAENHRLLFTDIATGERRLGSSGISVPLDFQPAPSRAYEDAEKYLRRIAALDCALHGHWSGPAEVDGVPDNLVERALELHRAWEGLYHTTLAADKIRADHAKLMRIIAPESQQYEANLTINLSGESASVKAALDDLREQLAAERQFRLSETRKDC